MDEFKHIDAKIEDLSVNISALKGIVNCLSTKVRQNAEAKNSFEMADKAMKRAKHTL